MAATVDASVRPTTAEFCYIDLVHEDSYDARLGFNFSDNTNWPCFALGQQSALGAQDEPA